MPTDVPPVPRGEASVRPSILSDSPTDLGDARRPQTWIAQANQTVRGIRTPLGN